MHEHCFRLTQILLVLLCTHVACNRSAQRAIAELNDTELKGRTIFVRADREASTATTATTYTSAQDRRSTAPAATVDTADTATITDSATRKPSRGRGGRTSRGRGGKGMFNDLNFPLFVLGESSMYANYSNTDIMVSSSYSSVVACMISASR
jgi:RNA recognition motif-containing protein